MKIKSIITGLILFCATSGNTFAQKAQGEQVLTAGTSFSLTSLIMNLVEDAINTNSKITAKSIPAINFMYDYGISESFSIGAAFSYQTWTFEYPEYKKDSITYTGNFKDRASRINFGVRPLFHFGSNENLDTYVGARLSFTQWSYISDSQNDKSVSDIFGANPIKLQALFGMRYYANDYIGFNMEFAVGPTYFAMFGLNVRFGGMK